jgi:hypothetical protein
VTSSEVLEYLEALGGEAYLLEPRSDYDPCLIGVGSRFKAGPLAVYDIRKVVAVLEAQMTEEQAQENFESQMMGVWWGDGTPIFVEL